LHLLVLAQGVLKLAAKERIVGSVDTRVCQILGKRQLRLALLRHGFVQRIEALSDSGAHMADTIR